MRLLCLTVLWLLVNMPAVWASESACQKVKPFNTEISIEMLTPPPVYDLTKNKAYLDNDGAKTRDEWLKKNSLQSIWVAKDLHTEGMATGGWGVFSELLWQTQPLDTYGTYNCIFFRHIDVQMMFRTLIMIPKEFPKGGCPYNLINEHELKHYAVNKDVANETTARLKRDISAIIQQLESQHVEANKTEAKAEEMKQAFQEVVDVYFKETMMKEMENRNDAVDSPEEYARVGNLKRQCYKVKP